MRNKTKPKKKKIGQLKTLNATSNQMKIKDEKFKKIKVI